MRTHAPGRWRARLAALAAAVSLGAAATAHATSLSYAGADRSVVAEFQISTQDDFDADTAVAATGGFDPFDAQVVVAGGTLGTAAEASASQDSVLLHDVAAGSGRAGAVTWTEVAPAFLSGRGESFFEVVFAVAADTGFRLNAEVGVTEDEIGDGFAQVSLVDLSTGAIVSEVSLDAAGRLPLAAAGTLRGGVSYALTGIARANAADRSGAGSDFGFELVLVPAPAAAVLATLSLVAVLARRRGEGEG